MVVLTIMSILFGAMAFSAIVGCVTSTPPWPPHVGMGWLTEAARADVSDFSRLGGFGIAHWTRANASLAVDTLWLERIYESTCSSTCSSSSQRPISKSEINRMDI